MLLSSSFIPIKYIWVAFSSFNVLAVKISFCSVTGDEMLKQNTVLWIWLVWVSFNQLYSFLEMFLMCLITSALSAKVIYFSSIFLKNKLKRNDAD